MKYYTHIPTKQICHKTKFLDQEYLVFESTKEMKAMTKNGIYSNHTIEELL